MHGGRPEAEVGQDLLRMAEVQAGQLPKRPFLDIHATGGERLLHGGCTWRRQTSYNPGERRSCGLRGNMASAVCGYSAPTPAEPPGRPATSISSSRWMARTSPWFPGGLVADLEALLGCRVDVVEPDALRPEMRLQALAEAVPL